MRLKINANEFSEKTKIISIKCPSIIHIIYKQHKLLHGLEIGNEKLRSELFFIINYQNKGLINLTAAN